MELEEEINPEKLQDFKVPDVDPMKIKRIKRYLMLLSTLLFSIAIIIAIVFIIKYTTKKYEINYKFITYGNETIEIINNKAIKDKDFELFINDTKIHTNTNSHYFSKPGIINVCFKFKKKLNSLSEFFYNIDRLIEIDLSKMNSEAFNNITRIFTDCQNLQKINFGKKDKKINEMNEAFSGCKSLTQLDLSSFNTEKVKDMGKLFSGCHSLTSIDISSFKTENVDNMEAMFSGCYSLENIDLQNFNFENVIDMSYMFSFCENLINIKFSKYETKQLNRMIGMFMNCSSLENINLQNFNTFNVEDMSLLFSNCIKLQNIDLSKFNTRKVYSMCKMFSNCQSLKSLDLSAFNTNFVKSMKEMFYNCINLTNITLYFSVCCVVSSDDNTLLYISDRNISPSPVISHADEMPYIS